MSKKVWLSLIVLLGVTLVATGCMGRLPGGAAGVSTGQADSTSVAKVSQKVVSETVESSGSLEARQFANLTWKTPGTVSQVKVAIGDPVKAGDILIELDPTSVAANVISAQSDLLNAQQSLDDLMNSKLPQAQAQKALEDAQNAFDQRDVTLQANQAQAMLALTQAKDSLDTAQKNRNQLDFNRSSESSIDTAKADYILAGNNLDLAQANFDRVSGRPEDDPVRAQALSALSVARDRRDAALRKLNWLQSPPSASEIEKADATLAQAKAKYAQALQTWEQVKSGLSDADVAILEAKLADAQRSYAQLKNGPKADDIAQLKARINAAQATINQMFIIAPFDGKVLAVNNQTGDVVANGQVALVVANLDAMYVDVQVDETDIARMHIGAQAVVAMDAIPGARLTGSISSIDPVGSVVGGLVKYSVRIDLKDIPQQVLLGATADVTIQVSEPAEALVVPVDAVQNDDQGEYVIRINSDGSQQRVPVQSGLLVDDQVVVKGDLSAGDAVQIVQQATQAGPGGFFGR